MGRWLDKSDDGFLQLYAMYRGTGNPMLLEELCEDWFVDLARSAVMVDRTLPARFKRMAQANAVTRCKRACEALYYVPEMGAPFQLFNRICHNERKRAREQYEASKLKPGPTMVISLDELHRSSQPTGVSNELLSDPGDVSLDTPNGTVRWPEQLSAAATAFSGLAARNTLDVMRKLSAHHAAVLHSISEGDGQTRAGAINVAGIRRDTKLQPAIIDRVLTDLRETAASFFQPAVA